MADRLRFVVAGGIQRHALPERTTGAALCDFEMPEGARWEFHGFTTARDLTRITCSACRSRAERMVAEASHLARAGV